MKKKIVSCYNFIILFIVGQKTLIWDWKDTSYFYSCSFVIHIKTFIMSRKVA